MSAGAGSLYRMDLAYVGSGFHGWQSQSSGKGIQDSIEAALAKILRHSLRIRSASRTDTGVHAQHQVAVFRTPVLFDERRWVLSLNGLLPPEVRIHSIQLVSDTFHPIHSSTGKAYRYRIWNGPFVDPFIAPFCWQIHKPLDSILMRDAARALIGTHDFTSFCATDSSAKTRVRTVWDIHIESRGPLINIWVTGKGFLKQMVRNIVGTLTAVGDGRFPAGATASILAGQDRKLAGKTAPAQGLALVEIFFAPPKSIESLIEEAATGYSQSLVRSV